MNPASQQPRVTIYTDGACSGNPGPGGWAAVLLWGDHRKELSGGARHTTNNIMELTAAIQALRQLRKPCEVILYSDSRYLVQGMTEWLPAWVRRGWRRADKSPVANRSLWEELQRQNGRHRVEWHWIPAHHDDPVASHPENARCDELAREAIGSLESLD
jgi:ribonuclease HI